MACSMRSAMSFSPIVCAVPPTKGMPPSGAATGNSVIDQAGPPLNPAYRAKCLAAEDALQFLPVQEARAVYSANKSTKLAFSPGSTAARPKTRAASP